MMCLGTSQHLQRKQAPPDHYALTSPPVFIDAYSYRLLSEQNLAPLSQACHFPPVVHLHNHPFSEKLKTT